MDVSFGMGGKRELRTAVVVAATVVLAACGGGGSGGASASKSPEPGPASVSVTSSIPNGSVLDKAVKWTATVLPQDVGVTRVEFIIDGDVRWSEQAAPYEFNEGRLFAPWPLGNGPHE